MHIKMILIGALVFFCIKPLSCQEQTGETIMQKILSKETAMKTFLQDAIDYIKKHSIPEACHAFSKNQDWLRQDMFIIVLDDEGMCWVFGNDLTSVGKDFSLQIDPSGLNFLQRVQTIGTGYLVTGLNNAINNSVLYTCIDHIKKDNKNFYVMSAFYINDANLISYCLIQKTVELFNLIGVDKTATMVTDPFGTLRRGDIYIGILKDWDFIIAHGIQQVRVGQNVFQLKRAFLQIIKKEYEAFIKDNSATFLVVPDVGETRSNVMLKKYIDPKTKIRYIIFLSYALVTEKDIVDLVDRAINFIKDNKKETAFEEFTTSKNWRFKVGESTISVYDPDGFCLASGEYPNLVGFNRSDVIDEYGQYTLREMIDQALKYGETWVTIFDKNAYKANYAKKLVLPFEKFIVASGYWPMEKPKITKDVVKRGIQILNRFSEASSFEKFCDETPNFLRGDIKLIVIDEQGNTLLDGHNAKTFVWTTIQQRDKFHQNVIKKVLEQAKKGAGWIEEKLKYTTFHAFVESFTKKDNSKLILYAGYYE